MHIYNCPSYQEASEAVAEFIFDNSSDGSNCLFGIATGYSPKLVYKLIGEKIFKQPELKNKIKILQLDEWLGLDPTHPSSCHFYIQQEVINHWQLKKEQCTVIDGSDVENKKQINFLKNKLAHEKMDVCILGLGKNGHLALNEPGSQIDDEFRLVDLAASSQTHNMLQGNKINVTQGITIGLKEILESKLIVLIIAGSGKKEAYQKLMEKEAPSVFPASVLHFHNNIHCFIDESAIF